MATGADASQELEVTIPCEGLELVGDLTIPDQARGTVLIAHGPGSSRRSPRNRLVARRLQQSHFATLLIDLLTPDEEKEDARVGQSQFDAALLGERLTLVAEWLRARVRSAPANLGCFGASTGAAAALIAAASRSDLVGAVVSRGCRPDPADTEVLARVFAPTLLIVGGVDDLVIALNRRALSQLRGEKKLEIVPDATHLFEEPGALEQVAELAAGWFEQHLGGQQTAAPRSS